LEFLNDPMLRSGLVLSNVDNQDDNILTALEIAQMDLSDTELIVMSACETGLGDIHYNQGVFGLQKALKTAGAKNIVMSLWKVPDRQTKTFMTTFYKEWITKKVDIRTAFLNAQRQMKNRFYDPYMWAGFVLIN